MGGDCEDNRQVAPGCCRRLSDRVPLPSAFAYDTETDRLGDDIRTVMIQLCPIGAGSLKEVKVYLGLDCMERFFEAFEETMYDMDMHVYNLDYEFSWMKSYLKEHYEFVPFGHKRMRCGEWSCSSDQMTTYCVKVINRYGKELRMTDDAKKVGNCRMEKAGKSVRASHPDWFECVKDVKETVEYNNGWSNPEHPDHERFIHYGMVDAYSQAMIARYIIENNLDKCLTSASNGFMTALVSRYQGCTLADSDGKKRRFARMDFRKHYPPLPRDMQDIVEDSLLGGFVYGETGTWKGTFVHVDYSSSYPYEYAFGDLGRGKVVRVPKDQWDTYKDAPGMIRWYVVSFDFRYKHGAGMPCISGKECRNNGNDMIGAYNKKMTSGRVEHKLYTETYLQEIMLAYDCDMEYEEMWVQKKAIGDFRGFIEEMYHGKSVAPKDSMERALFKLNMNGGIHGKTITKTHRKERTFFDGVEELHDVVNDPQLQSTIGFTAMMNARARLLKHCRMIQEAGYKVMMCDTDSMVVNTTEENVRKVLGDAISKETRTMDDLGKFEFERSDDGCTEFDTFKCWGLKRYCEIHNGEYRKSAFAGMSEGIQIKELMGWDTDGSELHWQQNGSRTTDYGKTVMSVPKTAKAEDIWYHKCISSEAGKGVHGCEGLKNMINDMERIGYGTEAKWIL